MNPTWSPDGSRLAFVTLRNRRAEIFSMDAGGSDQRVMVSMPAGNAIDPRWSPVGDRLAFVFVPGAGPDSAAAGPVTTAQAIYTVDVASGRLTKISP
jgi:Tol biopolymer transport system component